MPLYAQIFLGNVYSIFCPFTTSTDTMRYEADGILGKLKRHQTIVVAVINTCSKNSSREEIGVWTGAKGMGQGRGGGTVTSSAGTEGFSERN